ncbi:response regulator [Floridanema evergladense]|uniref:Response regulator n=1 Tax=Floridaenema evergladense BLCC-F167 TaxID=3153639 RepID=A0ABV4WVI5_9CYAN
MAKSGKDFVIHSKGQIFLSSRILLVEDHDISRQLLSDYLSFLGYQVLAIADGAAFFSALSTFQPNLILLDLKIPFIDGYSILQEIQAFPSDRQIPIIVISAYAFKSDQQRALNLGAKKYFVKPINLSLLREAIQEILGGLTEQ